ncbi:MAG TPA: chitobiase/beta-hexosaminidase C-terminal domain-containing protein, partial [Armatimonadota bacterium]|nr:chitobiase/beta-hexosaminidase C-terminal domain-containing protein [Armatimonadota bacterium]
MRLRFGIIIFILFIASLASAQQVATPTFDPDGGTLVAIRRVLVHCATPGAIVRYTSNGLEPTEADPVVPPETHVTLDAGCTLKAKAFKAGMEPSETKSAIFTVRVYPLLCMPDGGLCAEPVMLASEPSSTIYYTLDGSEPGPGSPSVPTGGRILVDHPATLKAIAYKDGLLPSYVKTAQYSFRNPVILHVRADGSDQSSGLSWQEAKQTI